MSIHHLHRYNENELRSILDKLPSMVALIGPDRRYRIINRAYSRYFAVDEGDLSGRQASEIMPRAQYAMLERYLDETLASGSMTWIADHQADDGDHRLLSIKLLPHRMHDGKQNGTLIIAEDVTDSIHSQQAFCAVNNKLGRHREDRVARLKQELLRSRESESRLRRLAECDPLTDLLNRRTFEKRVLDEIRKADSNDKTSFMYIDLDHFKAVNDTHGHVGGDTVLNEFARMLRLYFRSTDHLGRIGGEEFAVCLPRTSPSVAFSLGERFRRAIEQTPVEHNGEQIHYTVSIGITEIARGEQGPAEAMERADVALYKAKHAGRNRSAVVA